jgi:hypothetical protein
VRKWHERVAMTQTRGQVRPGGLACLDRLIPTSTPVNRRTCSLSTARRPRWCIFLTANHLFVANVKSDRRARGQPHLVRVLDYARAHQASDTVVVRPARERPGGPLAAGGRPVPGGARCREAGSTALIRAAHCCAACTFFVQ